MNTEPAAWVRDYIGLPFESCGRTRAGVDCWGLVRLVYAQRLQVHLPSHHDGYTRVDDSQGVLGVFVHERQDSGHWAPVPLDEIREYDVLSFRAGHAYHVGVAVARGRMLHVCEGIEACVESFESPLWSKRLIGVSRHCGPVRLIGRVSPLTPARMEAQVEAGGTIAQILATAGIRATPETRVWIGDSLVPPEAWERVRPKPGRVLQVAVLPAGKQGGALRILMTIAVIAAAIYAPYALGPAWGMTTAATATAAATVTAKGALVSAAIGLGGMLAVSALIPPPRPRLSQGTSTQSPSITGGRNDFRPWEPFPVVLGLHRVIPMYGAVPYTEIAGDDQYLRMLFVVGHGPLAISDLRIGETPIEEFTGVEIEIREGYADDEPITLYPGTVREQRLSVLLQEVEGWTTRTLEIDADEISVDVTWPQGLASIGSSGSKNTRTCNVQVEYSPTGLGQWRRVNEESPDFSRGMDVLFRATDAPRGTGVQEGPVAWGGAWPGTKPTYLPMSSYAYELTGFIDLSATGTYEFSIDGSDSIELFVGGKLLASWYGQHEPDGAFGAHTGTLCIPRPTAGWRAVKIRVESRSPNGGALALGWKRPGDGAFSIVPSTALRVASTNRLATFGPVGRLNYRWRDVSTFSSDISLREARTGTIRGALVWAVPRGRYDVRVRRATPDTADDRILDKVYLTAIRAILGEPPIRETGLAQIALRIKATDQLSGTIDTFNLTAASILPDWDQDSQEWIQRATSSPAAHFRAIMQGPGNNRPLPDSRLDLAELQVWAQECRERGLEFNGVLDTASTVYERVSDVCAAGRATHGMRDGLHSVVRDRAQSVPVQHFTPRNSREYRGSRTFIELPHALRVRFVDSALGWKQNERLVLDDGFQIDGKDAFGQEAPDLPDATVYDVLELFGVTSGEQAFRAGRYFLAVARLRPETHELTVDLEHLVCYRGDLVLLTHDVPMFGLSAGRVSGQVLDTGGNLLGIDIDDEVVMDPGDAYSIRVRLANGASWVRAVQTQEGVHRRLMFTALVGPSDPRPEPGDLFVFGRTGQESRECLVKSILHDSDLSARLVLVDHAPAVHLADSGPIPPWDPGISRPADYVDRPETPVIDNIRSDDYVMVRGSDGTLIPRMVIELRGQSGSRPIATLAQVLTRPIPSDSPAQGPDGYRPLAPILASSVSVGEGEEGVTYEIRLRTVTPTGQASDWATAQHTIVGKSAPPPDVSTFGVTRLSDGTRRYTWTIANPPPDLAGVLIRFGPTWQTWSEMLPVTSDTLTTSPAELFDPPEGTWRFAIKAIDTSGNQSVNPLYATVSLGAQRLQGVAFSADDRLLGWPGAKSGCIVAGEILESIDSATWGTLASLGITQWQQWSRWNVSPTSPISYESSVLDAGLVFAFSPDAIVAGRGVISVEIATSIDGTTWSDWAPLSAAHARRDRPRDEGPRHGDRQWHGPGADDRARAAADASRGRRARAATHRAPRSARRGDWASATFGCPCRQADSRWCDPCCWRSTRPAAQATRGSLSTETRARPRVRLFGPGGAPIDATLTAVIRGL